MKRPVLLVAALALAAPASAHAASGTSALTLKGAAASSLAAAGVKVSAVKPATAKGRTVTFPVTTVTVGASASLRHAGALRFTKGKRTLTLKAPALALAGRGSRLTAKLGGRTVTIVTVDGAKRALNATAGTVVLKGATVKLSAAGAAAVRRALELRSLRAGALGTLTVDASTGSTGTSGSGSTGTGTPGTGGGATTGGGTPSAPGGGPKTKTCTGGAAPAASGGPTPLSKPIGAQDLTGGAITWHVRDSFIQYINSGEGTAVSGGATADPASAQPGSSATLTYQFHFPFKSGWYDPVSGVARLTYSGTVTFCYADHGIKLTASDPEVEVNGTSSRAIFVTDNVDTAAQRGVLVNLTPVARADDAATHTWTQMAGKIPADAGDSTFAGYYQAGDPFGWITVSGTTP